MPASLGDALDALEGDVELVEAVGAQLVAQHLAVKRAEWDRYTECDHGLGGCASISRSSIGPMRQRQVTSRELLDATDEVRAESLGRAVGLDTRDQALAISSNMTRSSSRARCAPRQRCALCSPKATWSLGVARGLEVVGVVELLLVVVRRDVPEDDLVAGLQVLTAQLGVLDDGATKMHGRRSPTQHLVDEALSLGASSMIVSAAKNSGCSMNACIPAIMV